MMRPMRPKRLGRLMRPAVLALVAPLLLAGCDTDPLFPPIEEIDFHPSLGVDLDALTMLPGGTGYEVLDPGEGTEELDSPADEVFLNYRLWLADGTLIDEGALEGNLDGVIVGFWEDIRGMVEGEERLIVIPPSRGYAGRRQGDIPPWSWLIFRVELVELNAGADGSDGSGG